MAKDSSFDVVSEPDWSEVLNAIDQTRREVSTRYDFRGHDIHIDYDAASHIITLEGPPGMVMESLQTVLGEKMAKRKVSLRFLEFGEVQAHGMNRGRQSVTLKSGIATDVAKKIQKAIRSLGLKVNAEIQGDSVRVSGKNRDDLQAVIQALKAEDFGLELAFVNYRSS